MREYIITSMWPQRMIKMTLLLYCLCARGASSKNNDKRVSEPAITEEACTPCDVIFSKLEATGRDGKLAQDLRVQERGEPKSGTGVAYFWASAALMRACGYLNDEFGPESCQVVKNFPGESGDELIDRYPNYRMIFEPALGSKDARCPCETIDRVSIILSSFDKHTLPVDANCAFNHGRGMGFGHHELRGRTREPPCTFADGSHVSNGGELWQCMHEADCDIADDWLQMAVFRDPRPAIVSTFYHIQVHGANKTNMDLGDVEAFVARELPNMCQWIAIRYILFSGILAETSTEFWYEDSMIDPLKWHYQLYFLIGLQLPFHVVEATAEAAVADMLNFGHKDVDVHPGEEKRTEGGARRFEDEVSPEAVELADAVLRTWLPSVLLERFGVVA